ncbi:alpha/beta hydrolase [Caballeronia sp. dw_19]|uniref:alpha/beta fold hydrolase n=1 Tax=Caballeronia sp. dw_19 TaxID=2719791 RepID=UPI001BD29182|nr:alpha/beta hydrolase [Caballeronia sp. dw_19]
MSHLTMKDGTQLFYKDWGNGPPIVLSHCWPLDADAWDAQMLFLLHKGYRVIAHDRRGHGRSSQPWNGHEMDTYADDLATLIGALDLSEATLIGHSAGGGEVTRYVGRHGTERVSKVILISAVPPLMLKTPTNPGGLPIEVFNDLRQKTATQRTQLFRDLAVPFYGYNRPGAQPVQGVIDSFWAAGMMGSIQAEYECIKAFSETDFTDDLNKFNVPTLFIHGSDDQVVPIGNSTLLAAQLTRNSTVKIYPGAPHGLCSTLPHEVNADIFAFLAD